MLGTSSWGMRAVWAGLTAGALALGAGCLRNVDQRANSGKDYRDKGAKEIKLEGGEANAKGIVTYPGGDREDWRKFEIPEGSKGKVEIRLKHKPPRPGLDVAFNVYDQFGKRIARAKPAIKKPDRTKRVKISGIEPGTYFVQIYAPRRMDAGKWRLRVRFKEVKEVAQVDIEALADQIPDPPVLPAPIEPVVLSPEEKAAKEEAERLAQEEEEKRKAEEAARLAAAPKPVTGKILAFQKAGNEVIVTINRGKNDGVDLGWGGQLLKGGAGGSAVPGGGFKVMKVTDTKSVGKVPLQLGVVRANPWVLLSPP